MLKAREAVRNLNLYSPPLEGRTGLLLDFNENTAGCSPRVLARMRQLQPQQLARYPERGRGEEFVAGFLGLRASEVLLTNGVDEGIHLLCATYLEAEDEALIVVPTFSMYEIYARATGARVITVQAEDDFRFPLRAVLARLSPRTRLIAIANPNSPTGAVVEGEVLLRIVQAAPQAAVLVDEAYFEFYGETLLGQLATLPNLFVARTFSKAYGMAGLRIGVLAGDEERMGEVRRVASPYNVNGVALACLPEALGDQEYIQDYVAQVLRSRARLEHELRILELQYWPSHANFVLVRLGERRESFVQGMRERGILVRDRNSDPGCGGCVRITIGTEAQTDQLVEALRSSLEQCAAGKVAT